MPLYINHLILATFSRKQIPWLGKVEYTSIFREVKYATIVILNVKRVSTWILRQANI